MCDFLTDVVIALFLAITRQKTTFSQKKSIFFQEISDFKFKNIKKMANNCQKFNISQNNQKQIIF